MPVLVSLLGAVTLITARTPTDVVLGWTLMGLALAWVSWEWCNNQYAVILSEKLDIKQE